MHIFDNALAAKFSRIQFANFFTPSHACALQGFQLSKLEYLYHDLFTFTHLRRYTVWHADAMHSVWQLEQHKDV